MHDESPPRYAWTVHPLRDNWKRSALLLLFLVLLFSSIYWSFRSISITILSAIFLISSLHRYFVPSRYEFHDDCLVVTSLSRRITKPWFDFHSFYVDLNGVLLSPFAKPSRLENFRGVYVRFGSSPPDEIVDFIQRKVTAESVS